MLKNHIKSIFRALKRNKSYAAINITGLAIGFASAALIAIYVFQEFTYDKHYAEHERIYRVSARGFAFSSIAHLDLIKSQVAGVQYTTNVMSNPSGTIRKGVSNFIEKELYYGTKDYLRIFNQEFIYGNPETAFDQPNAVLLTNTIAQKIFGSRNPVGEELEVATQISDEKYYVGGVVKDLPTNTHLKWQVMARFPQEFEQRVKENFGFTTGYSYIKHESAVPAEQIQQRVNEVFGKLQFESRGQGLSFEEYLAQNKASFPWILSLADIHLNSDILFEAEPPGKESYLYIFMGIALFIIVLAAINYVNLATAQASKKAKEVGVRKVLGSVRSHLISRFLTESVLLTTAAVLIGLGLAETALVSLQGAGFSNFQVNVYDFPELILMMLGVALLVGLLAGIYPAFYLTSFKPSSVLKGDFKAAGQSKWFRNSLVLFQYVVSLTLTVFAVFIYQQLNYSLEKDLGFDKENVLVIDNSSFQLGDEGEAADAFKNELLKNPAVSHVSASHFSMVNKLPISTITAKDEEQKPWRIQYKYTDDQFIPTMGFEVRTGRIFNPELDEERGAMIINETFAKQLGGDVLGLRFNAGVNGEDVEVVGVVEDYHYEDMSTAIGPTAFFYRTYPSQISVRIKSPEIAKTVSEIEAVYGQFSKEPFDYRFFDQQFDQLFNREKTLGQIVTIFTGLAIFVALMGLVGLISYKLDQRIKEIGIRKVLGASVKQIVALFSKELLSLVLLSILVMVPLGFYITSTWLDSFAYHIDIQWLPFVIVGISGLLITLLTVVLRTIKSALMNPTTALRTE